MANERREEHLGTLGERLAVVVSWFRSSIPGDASEAAHWSHADLYTYHLLVAQVLVDLELAHGDLQRVDVPTVYRALMLQHLRDAALEGTPALVRRHPGVRDQLRRAAIERYTHELLACFPPVIRETTAATEAMLTSIYRDVASCQDPTADFVRAILYVAHALRLALTPSGPAAPPHLHPEEWRALAARSKFESVRMVMEALEGIGHTSRGHGAGGPGVTVPMLGVASVSLPPTDPELSVASLQYPGAPQSPPRPASIGRAASGVAPPSPPRHSTSPPSHPRTELVPRGGGSKP
ncbi:hypothetical protein HYV74_04215 [Candidatus Uhrbacteria bacterium]|nr:hypothetical protein [Candidatus Uhrbacteria bacterium]